jgi:glycosyltransferase involved in cell wall biosynthesis
VADTTIVIACFNYGRFLPEAVASCLAQEPRPDVIVVDDGSTDPPTHAALEALPDSVRVIRQVNGGAASARNAGLRASDTRYVAALDADDRLAPGALALLRSALDEAHARDRRVGFAYGHQRFFGGMSGEMRMPPYDPYKLLHRHLIGPTALTLRALLDDTGGWDPAFLTYEDWELWLAALAHGWYGVRVDAVAHEYRRHPDGKLLADRRVYREFRRQAKVKHAALYARSGELARDSPLGPFGRAVYAGFWGPRPLPAAVEGALHRVLWRGEDQTSSGGASSG